MTERVHWYFAEAARDTAPRAFARRLLSRPFSSATGKGFLLDEVKAGRVIGRYVEQVLFVEKVIDPLGHEQSFKRVAYKEVRFRYAVDAPQLELINPPRAISTFVAQLMQLYEGEISVRPTEVNVRKMIKALDAVVGKLVVERLDVGGVLVSDDVLARIAFAGQRDVRRAASEFLHGREPLIERARVTWKDGGEPVSCVLRPTSARFDADQGKAVRAALRAALAVVMDSPDKDEQ